MDKSVYSFFSPPAIFFATYRISVINLVLLFSNIFSSVFCHSRAKAVAYHPIQQVSVADLMKIHFRRKKIRLAIAVIWLLSAIIGFAQVAFERVQLQAEKCINERSTIYSR